MNHKLSAYQISLWLFTAIAGPVVAYSNGNWFGILVIGVILSSMCWLSLRFGAHWEGRVYQLVQILWLCVILSQLLPFSANCWPTAAHAFPAVPLTLLALAAMAAQGGSKSTACGISILFWSVVGLIGIVIAAGCGDLRGEYQVARAGPPKDIFYLIFLIPATSAFVGWGKGGKHVLTLLPLFAAGIAFWIAGSISHQLADVVAWPFYEAAKSVQLLDVAKRFESLVSAGVTVGNYALYSLLLCAIRSLGDRLGMGREAVTISALIAGCITLWAFEMSVDVMVAVSFVLWICLPLLGVLKCKKNGENSHN